MKKIYITISSSAVYPEYGVQPFLEEAEKAVNKFWGKYGTDKTEAAEWYLANESEINKKPYFDYIDTNLA